MSNNGDVQARTSDAHQQINEALILLREAYGRLSEFDDIERGVAGIDDQCRQYSGALRAIRAVAVDSLELPEDRPY